MNLNIYKISVKFRKFFLDKLRLNTSYSNLRFPLPFDFSFFTFYIALLALLVEVTLSKDKQTLNEIKVIFISQMVTSIKCRLRDEIGYIFHFIVLARFFIV